MASPTPGPSGTPQDQDLGPAQFTYPPVAQNPHQRYPPVPTRTEAVSHPLGSDERRRPADFDSGIRTKAVVVSGPERDQHDQAIAEIREHTERERKQRLEAEASNRRLMDSNRQLLDQMGQMQQQVQQMMQQQQQMQQQLTSTPSEQSEPQSEPQRVMINQQDEDMEDDEMEQVRAELESGRMTQQRLNEEKQRLNKVVETQKNEIAGLVARTRLPAGRAPSPQPSFPTTEPQMIPRFMGSQPRAARKVRLLKSSGRPLPSTSLRRDEAAKEPENLREDGIDVDLLSKIVKEILEKLGVMALIVEETAGSSRSRRGPTKQAKAIKAQQSRMTKEEDLWWKTQTMVRQVWRNKYSTDTAAEFASYVPAAERLVQLCNDGIAGPPEDVFILDFSKGYQTSLWNDAIIQKFTMALQAAHRESSDQWGVSEASDLYVSGEFYNQLKQSREAWAKWQPRLVLDALEMETAEEVKSRVETAEQRRRAKGASNSAKHRKFTRRKSCVQLTLKLKDDQEVDVGTWQYLQDLLERLGKDGMSSEEEGVHDLGTTVVSVYYVKLCVWRAKPITDYMLLIDRSAAEVKTSKGGSSGPRIRANTNPIGTTAAPPGLPRKMYDEQWLAEREKNAPYWVSTTLRVSEEAFQFLVSTMEEDLDL
ncbi:hypothetical protein B0H14DRAFT_3689865 [Mycena olivaceomarginata]|nr:hypothetical protein B0H14DRAFT_3689865 [Mycena olivaceomarginata]